MSSCTFFLWCYVCIALWKYCSTFQSHISILILQEYAGTLVSSPTILYFHQKSFQRLLQFMRAMFNLLFGQMLTNN